jgi:predicted metal-dependent phosphoesterase TrpH
MKTEIHAHTNVYSACSRMAPRDLIVMAEASGYDALFLTDHGKVWSERDLAEACEWSDHLLVLPGIEISLPSGMDLLVLGANDPDYEKMDNPGDIFAKACADGCLTVIAHPFRWTEVLPEYCRLADAVETRSCNHPLESQAEAAGVFAVQHNLAEVFSSDAHGLNFLNRFWIETDEPFANAREFRQLIVGSSYTNCQRDDGAPLPPVYKAATMDELEESDREALTA